ncbi:MAG: undecaprenyl-diphosphate phosphatase [Candidatus Peregrinibacteria bacterium]|nr:undecaprenyl-diphosphate phosphatase [Candidatus Peregrinibacteria bacterium]
MTILQSFILGIIQGITEFLPISSSGHLVIFESWFGLQVTELRSFDVVVHIGTLLAILIYFRKDILDIFKQIFRGDFRMTGFLILATIPAVIAGFTMQDVLDGYFRSSEKVAFAMIGCAVLFVIAEYFGKRNGLNKPQNVAESVPGHTLKLTWPKIIFIGLLQSVALIPGVSRSGSTISAGLMVGLSRTEAARFSFLLGSIAIFGAGLLTAKDVISDGLYFPEISVAITGFVASLLAGYFSVTFLMKFLKNHSLHVFALYLVILAGSVFLF